MSLDVVVVTYRSADGLDRCLASIPDGPEAHVIVVDNASGDAGPQIARDHGCAVVENDDNRGFAAAANQGARAGRGDLILFLNPDARLRPGAVDALVERLADPAVAIVGARLIAPDGSPQRSTWPYPSARRMWAEAFGLDRLGLGHSGWFVVGACLLIRRTVFEAVGGFDERYWLYGEEADLCFRVEQVGGRVVSADDALVEHEGGASGRDARETVADHFARGSDRFVLDHEGPGALVSYRLAGVTASALRYLPLRLDPRRRDRAVARADHLRRAVRSLLRHPTTVPSTSVRAPSPEIVLLSLEPWDEVWRRNQFLVRELLRERRELRVLWVEPAADALHELRLTRRMPRLGAAEVRRLPGEPRLMLVRPRKWLPRSIYPWVDQSLSRQVRRAMRRSGFGADSVLWVNDSTYFPLVQTSPSRCVYDITDDWLDASGPPRQLRRLERRERALLGAADEVVVCSPELARRRSATRRVHLVPNAVDADHFRRPHARPADLPSGPIAVYVGTLHDDRIDVDLVVDVAVSLPDLSVVLVGPDSLTPASRSRLDAIDNVHLLGTRPYAVVPAYLQHADVVIVPHLVSPFTESLDPIKAYECLAAGRPTLATPVAGFRELAGAVRVAERSEFIAELGTLLAAPSSTMEPIGVPTWTERAAQFRAILDGAAGSDNDRRFSVVYLGHTAVASGGELALARLLPGLSHVDAHVILGTDGPMVERFRATGATVEVLPFAEEGRGLGRESVTPGRLPLAAVSSTARYTRTLTRRLRELRPDVVHTNTLKSAIYGGVAARLAGVPVVWHIRDRISPDYLPRPAVMAIRALAHVIPAGILTNSRATQATLGATRRVVAVTPSPVVRDPVEQVSEVDGRPDALVVGMIGRLAPWKGQDVFVRAFATAFPDGDAQAVIVGGALFGEDEFAGSLRSLIADLGLTDRVELTGHVDNIGRQLARMDVVVHASVIPEPFGQVVVEAMAAGKPVIASNEGGPSEIVREGVDGLLVPPNDVGELAAALRRLADDPEQRARLGRAARGVGDRFSAHRIGVEVERVYRRVAEPPPLNGRAPR